MPKRNLLKYLVTNLLHGTHARRHPFSDVTRTRVPWSTDLKARPDAKINSISLSLRPQPDQAGEGEDLFRKNLLTASCSMFLILCAGSTAHLDTLPLFTRPSKKTRMADVEGYKAEIRRTFALVEPIAITAASIFYPTLWEVNPETKVCLLMCSYFVHVQEVFCSAVSRLPVDYACCRV